MLAVITLVYIIHAPRATIDGYHMHCPRNVVIVFPSAEKDVGWRVCSCTRVIYLVCLFFCPAIPTCTFIFEMFFPDFYKLQYSKCAALL